MKDRVRKMFLSKDMAEKIIHEMSKIVSYDMNIMNEEGIILASTDPPRVGEFHEGAFLILKQRKSELLVFHDGEYQGCKKGINLPIILERDIIGVIGMTGEVDEILHYGKIIKKMSEILLMEYMYYYKRNLIARSRSYLVSEWIHDRFGQDTDTPISQLAEFHFDPAGTYIVAILKNTGTEILGSSRMEDLEEDLFRQFAINQMVVGAEGNFYILIANNISMDRMKTIIRGEKKRIEETHKIRLRCAIGGIHMKFAGVPVSYKEAYEMMNVAEYSKIDSADGVFSYQDMLFELILAKMQGPLLVKYRDHVFQNCSETERESFCRLILLYVKRSGSIQQIADESFSHKNTIQYRIGRIRDKTGLDLRNGQDMVQLYIAAIASR